MACMEHYCTVCNKVTFNNSVATINCCGKSMIKTFDESDNEHQDIEDFDELLDEE